MSRDVIRDYLHNTNTKFIPLIQQSVSRHVQRLFQIQLTTSCDLQLPPSDESIVSSPEGHPVAFYFFFLLFRSLLPSFIFPSLTCRRRQFIRKMWPIQLAFRLLISCRIFLCSLTLTKTVEPLLSRLMTGCRWPDNKKSRIIEDDPKRPVNAPRTVY
jgi:hypothetical protein